MSISVFNANKRTERNLASPNVLELNWYHDGLIFVSLNDKLRFGQDSKFCLALLAKEMISPIFSMIFPLVSITLEVFPEIVSQEPSHFAMRLGLLLNFLFVILKSNDD